jgi:FAD/FMN-containing dehydrogenase
MTMTAAGANTNDLAGLFVPIVGADNVVTDAAERRYYSNDIFFWDGAETADLVVRPRSTEEVSAVIRKAREVGLVIATRGGGMSYTKGYIPARPGTVMIDMLGLNRVIEVNADDRYVVAETGCTWQAVFEEVEKAGLAVAFAAPYSGVYSTVGGALSQNVPQGMDEILAIEVVRADGSVLRTGSWGRCNDANPFFRHYGPDLTGLFLGDTGSFGIKTRAVMKLVKKQAGIAYASFAFESYEDEVRAMIDMSHAGIVTGKGVLGLDPYKSQAFTKVSFKDAISSMAEVSKGKGGIRNTIQMATQGRHFMDGVTWSMHLTFDGVNDAAAEARMEIARKICLKYGREIANILPKAMAARRFFVRGFLGEDGERWVPTNAMFPLSQAVKVVTEVQRFFAARRAELDRHNMIESYMTHATDQYFLCEPSFLWPDEVSELHLRHLDKPTADRFRDNPPHPEARAFAQKLRLELRDLFYDLGAVNVQLAKFYRYQDSLEPGAARLIGELKDLLDPDHALSPGNLGFE